MDLDYKNYLSTFNEQVRADHLNTLKLNLQEAKDRVAQLEDELKETVELFKTVAVNAVETVQDKVEEVVEAVTEEVKKAAPKKAASKKAAAKKDENTEEVAPEKEADSDK